MIRDWLLLHKGNLYMGVVSLSGSTIASALGYFAPIKEMILVLFAVVVFDLITGIWASRVKGQGIRSKRLTKTAIKIFLYFGNIVMMFAIGEVYNIDLVKPTGFLILGFEAYSVLENCAVITDHPIFRIIKKLMRDKIEQNTGVDINEEKDK